MRQYARSEEITRNYAEFIRKMNDEEIANLCITLIHQAIYMLHKLIATMQERFVTEGGIKERMLKARLEYRGNRSNRNTQSSQNTQSDQKGRNNQNNLED